MNHLPNMAGDLSTADDDDDDDDDVERASHRCYIAFECAANDHVPKLTLQFQSSNFEEWVPERSWIGEYGGQKGVWAILDGLRWG